MLEEIGEEKYNSLYQKQNLSFLQSWQWGEIKEPIWKPLRISDGRNCVSILLKKLPFSKKYLGYIPRLKLDSGIISSLSEYLKSRDDIGLVLLEPDISDFDLSNLIEHSWELTHEKTIQPQQTNQIDLSLDEDPLWYGLRASARRNIKKSRKNNFKVTSYTEGDEAFEKFLKVNKQISTRRSFSRYDEKYLEKVWNIFSESGMALIHILSSADGDCGAYLVIRTQHTLYELYGGINDSAKKSKAGHQLKWESIIRAKNSGLKLYDQWGVAPLKDPDSEDLKTKSPILKDFNQIDPLYFISEFKFTFGGKYIPFPKQYVLVNNKLAFSIYKLSNHLLKLKKYLTRE